MTKEIKSGGLVEWPTGYRDDGSGSTLVCAVVFKPGFDFEVGSHRKGWVGWKAAPRVEIDDAEFRSANGIIAFVPLGWSDANWVKDNEGVPEITQWRASKNDITPIGLVLVIQLQRLYELPVRILTFVDT